MARINRMKGLDYIFHLAEYFNNNSALDKSVIIDLYGPIENRDKEYFFLNLNKHTNVSYKGILPTEEIYETLTKYDLMIFPTRFYTEGFPGTILDSYIAGLPIVSTYWKFAADFIIQGKTGLIVPFEDSKNEFINAVVKLYNDPDLLLTMKLNAYEQSKNYSAENAWDILVKNRLA